MNVNKFRAFQEQPLFRFLTWNGYFFRFFISIITAAGLVACASALIPLAAGLFFTHILPSGNRQLLQYLPLVLTILLLIVVAVGWLRDYILRQFIGAIVLNLRITLFERQLSSWVYRADLSTALPATTGFSAIKKLQRRVILLCIHLFRDGLMAVGLFAVMFILNPETTVLISALLIVALLIVQLSQTNIHRNTATSAVVAHPKIVAAIYNTLQHYRSIRLDQGYFHETQHIQHLFKQLQTTQLKQFNYEKRIKLLAIFFLTGIFAIFSYFFIQQIISQRSTPGDAVSFLVATLMLVFLLKQLLEIGSLFKQCNRISERLFLQLDQPTYATPRLENTLSAHHPQKKSQSKYLHLSSSEPNFPILTDSRIRVGSKIALVNTNPSINKKFIEHVCSLTPLTTRETVPNNQISEQQSATESYNRIAWITPDQYLLNDTVAANIAYGAMRCSTEIAITTAARDSGAVEFIRKMPDGLQTPIENSGMTLPADQRQRILIARALLKNPTTIILDETTGNFETQHISLLRVLKVLMENRTVFILSSRPAMLEFAECQFDPNELT